MDNDQESNEPGFKSYADFVAQLSQRCPQYEFLSHFFSLNMENYLSETTVWVIDSVHGRLEEKNIQPDSVHLAPPSVKTRLVLIEYSEAWTIDRNILDQICFNLDVPPFFLWQHFDHDELWLEGGPTRIGLGPTRERITARQHRSLEIGDLAARHASFLVVDPPNSPKLSIVLMLIRGDQEENIEAFYKPSDIPGPRSAASIGNIPRQRAKILVTAHRNNLLSMDESFVRSADNNPLEYAIPFIDIKLHQIIHDIQNHESQVIQLNDKPWTDEEEFREESLIMNRLSTRLDTMREHLKCAAAEQETFHPQTSFHLPLAESNKIKTDLDNLKTALRDLIQRETGILAVQESRKSIREAQSVRNLSQLAYIFIPLAYCASLFGMNVSAMQNAHLTTFVATSAVTLILSLLSLWILPRLPSPSWEALRRWPRWLTCVVLLARCSPTSCLVMASCVVVHSWEVVEEVFEELGLVAVLLEKYAEYIPPSVRFKKLKVNGSPWSNFWVRRIEKVAVVTSKRGWQDDRFWRRPRKERTDETGGSDA